MTGQDHNHGDVGIDVIVRFHDPNALMQLERAVFSLVGQFYRPIQILLVTQRFTPRQMAEVQARLQPLWSWADGVSLHILNFTSPEPRDARSELINLGLASASGRYLAILDYDDVLYPEAYQMLIGQLERSGAAIAFARTQVVLADVYDDFLHARAYANPFSGYTLGDLFRSNFCPIHSYVIDRWKIPEGLLGFEPTLAIEEDYEQLLRICARVTSDFTLIDTNIGLYFYKSDGSNTFSRDVALPPEVTARIEAARYFIEARRRLTALAPQVQLALGIEAPRELLTIREWIDEVSEV